MIIIIRNRYTIRNLSGDVHLEPSNPAGHQPLRIHITQVFTGNCPVKSRFFIPFPFLFLKLAYGEVLDLEANLERNGMSQLPTLLQCLKRAPRQHKRNHRPLGEQANKTFLKCFAGSSRSWKDFNCSGILLKKIKII